MRTRRRTVQVPQVCALVRHEQSDWFIGGHISHAGPSQLSQAVSRRGVPGSFLSHIRSPCFGSTRLQGLAGMTATRSKKTVAKDVEPYIEIPVRTRPTKVAQHPPKTIPKKVKRKGATAAASTQSAPNTGAAAAAEKAKDAAGADGGDEDSDDDENSSAEVERMLTSPGKTQGDKGTVSEKATRRDTTAVPETENEGEGAVFPGPTRSQRAARSYGKKASTSKDKEKTHEPQVEEAGDEAEDEVDQLDSDDAAPPAAQKENVPPAAASSSKRPASASQGKKQRPPPKKRVVTRQTSQTPSSRPSPDQQAPFDGLANSMTKKAAKEVETGISHPPRIFQHRTPNGWRPDKIWVHDEWDEPGERGNVVKYIEVRPGAEHDAAAAKVRLAGSRRQGQIADANSPSCDPPVLRSGSLCRDLRGRERQPCEPISRATQARSLTRFTSSCYPGHVFVAERLLGTQLPGQTPNSLRPDEIRSLLSGNGQPSRSMVQRRREGHDGRILRVCPSRHDGSSRNVGEIGANLL